MGCGCGKKSVNTQRGTRGVVAQTAEQELFDVVGEDGNLVASYTNPVTARSEARRIGGVVRDPQAPVPAG